MRRVHTRQAVILTRYGLMKPYGDIDQSQHWPSYWFSAWRHQAFTWTNVDVASMTLCVIQLRTNSHELHKAIISKIKLKMIYLDYYEISVSMSYLVVPNMAVNRQTVNYIFDIHFYSRPPSTRRVLSPVIASVRPFVRLSVRPERPSCSNSWRIIPINLQFWWDDAQYHGAYR